MTLTPWAQAVEAMRQADYHSVCGCCEQMHQPECYDAMLRAALPHLLRAVVASLTVQEIGKELCPPVDEHGNMEWWFNDPESFRAALLSALTDAAGRVG